MVGKVINTLTPEEEITLEMSKSDASVLCIITEALLLLESQGDITAPNSALQPPAGKEN